MTRQCVYEGRCAQYDRRSGMPADSGLHPLCSECCRAVRIDLGLLTYDYVDLSQLIARRDQPPDARIARPKPKSQPPIDLDVDSLRADIAETLWIWQQAVSWARGLPAPDQDMAARAGWRVAFAVAALLPRVQLWADLPPIGAFHDGRDEPLTWMDGFAGIERLRMLHRRARRHAAIVPTNISLPGQCPQCSTHSLFRADGTDNVSCGNCRRMWPYDEYSLYVKLEISAE